MHSFCGSPCYCSPELLRKEDYDGIKSDIYSLGVCLYCMVTGQFPWNIENTQRMIEVILQNAYSIPGYVSPQCSDLIRRLMALNPADRPSHEEILNHPWFNILKTEKEKISLSKDYLFHSLYDSSVFIHKSKIAISHSIGRELHVKDLLNENAGIIRKKSSDMISIPIQRGFFTYPCGVTIRGGKKCIKQMQKKKISYY